MTAAEENVKQVRATVQSQLWSARREARVAYFAAARAEAEVQISEQLGDLMTKIASIAEHRLQAGSGSRFEEQQTALVAAHVPHVTLLVKVAEVRCCVCSAT